MPGNRLRRWLPSAETVRANPSLRWLRPLLSRPWLWRLDRRHVSRGVALGVFFGFMVPIAQIFMAALFALVLRANLPVAAVSTLVSNPLTYAPIAVLAYRTGAAILGEQVDEARSAALESDPGGEREGWLARIATIGKPLFLGLAVFASVGAALAWSIVNLVWLGVLVLRARRRRAASGRR